MPFAIILKFKTGKSKFFISAIICNIYSVASNTCTNQDAEQFNYYLLSIASDSCTNSDAGLQVLIYAMINATTQNLREFFTRDVAKDCLP